MGVARGSSMMKICPVGVSTLALGAALASSSSFAALPRQLVVTTVADYNAALVAQTGGTLTVNAGLATYHVNSGSLEINSRFTVTLPSGFTFFSQPSLFDHDATSSLTLISGGIGSQTATFRIQGAPVETGDLVEIDSFSVQGATALETLKPVADALPITMQATNNSEIANNDTVPLSAGAFASEPGIKPVFDGAIRFIDLTAPILGTKFGTDPATDSLTAVLAQFSVSPELSDPVTGTPVLTPSGTPNSLSTSDTATVTVSGLFNGIATTFSSTSPDCTQPLGTGTVSAGTVTYQNVPIDTVVFLCVTADGTQLLQQNPFPAFNPTIAPGTSTDFLGTGCAPSVCSVFPGQWTYFGGGVVQVTNFFTGDDAGYTSLLRANNAGTGPATLYAVVQPDTGGPQLTGLIGTLGAGMGTVFTEAQVQADVPGLNLANSGQRATLQLIVAGEIDNAEGIAAPRAARHLTAEQVAALARHFPAGHGALPAVAPPTGGSGVVSAAGFLVNPSGTVTQMPGNAKETSFFEP